MQYRGSRNRPPPSAWTEQDSIASLRQEIDKLDAWLDTLDAIGPYFDKVAHPNTPSRELFAVAVLMSAVKHRREIRFARLADFEREAIRLARISSTTTAIIPYMAMYGARERLKGGSNA